jgi:hypothetical protein
MCILSIYTKQVQYFRFFLLYRYTDTGSFPALGPRTSAATTHHTTTAQQPPVISLYMATYMKSNFSLLFILFVLIISCTSVQLRSYRIFRFRFDLVIMSSSFCFFSSHSNEFVFNLQSLVISLVC